METFPKPVFTAFDEKALRYENTDSAPPKVNITIINNIIQYWMKIVMKVGLHKQT